MNRGAASLMSASGGGLVYMARDFLRPFRLPPSQSGLMTQKKLERLINAGYGLGHLHQYKPWLRTTRKDNSPTSNVGHLFYGEQNRLQHVRSMGERQTILVARWLGCFDAREQYPFWPWTALHPECGLPGAILRKNVDGMLDVAAKLGIDHGVFVGTSLPYVYSIDVLLTAKRPDGTYSLTALDCKPRDIVQKAPVGARVHQRIALGAAYSAAAGIHHVLVHAEELPRYLVTNLSAIYPVMKAADLTSLRDSALYQRCCYLLKRYGYEKPASAVMESAAQRFAITREKSHLLLKTAIWTQDVDLDLTLPLELYEPLVPGGRELRNRLARAWHLPEVAHG